jgi:DNA-binding protein HU-beta
MNHSDLVSKVAEVAQTSKAAAAQAVDAVVQALIEAVKSGEEVRITGLGTFDVLTRDARPGRNPQTGETIHIPATKPATVKLASSTRCPGIPAAWRVKTCWRQSAGRAIRSNDSLRYERSSAWQTGGGSA